MKFKFFFIPFILVCFLCSCKKEDVYNLTILIEDAYTKQLITDSNIAFDAVTKSKSDTDGVLRLEEILEGDYQLVCYEEGYLKYDSIISIPAQRNLKIKLQPLITLIAKPSYLDFGKNYSELYFTICNPYDDAPTKKFKISTPTNWVTVTPSEVDVVRQGCQTIKVAVNRSKMTDVVSEGRIAINIEPNNSKNTIPSITIKAEK